MKLITLYIPEPYIKALGQLVDEKYYPNRAEAIRIAVRDMLTVEVWEKSDKTILVTGLPCKICRVHAYLGSLRYRCVECKKRVIAGKTSLWERK